MCCKADRKQEQKSYLCWPKTSINSLFFATKIDMQKSSFFIFFLVATFICTFCSTKTPYTPRVTVTDIKRYPRLPSLITHQLNPISSNYIHSVVNLVQWNSFSYYFCPIKLRDCPWEKIHTHRVNRLRAHQIITKNHCEFSDQWECTSDQSNSSKASCQKTPGVKIRFCLEGHRLLCNKQISSVVTGTLQEHEHRRGP